MVREFEPLASACLCIALDMSSESNVGSGREASFEYAVRIGASIARFGCMENLRIRIEGEGKRPLHIPHASGHAHFQTILDALAVVDANGQLSYAALLERIALTVLRGETVVVFLSGPDSKNQTTLQAIAHLRTRGAHILAIVFNKDSFEKPLEKRKQAARSAEEMLSATLLELGARCHTIRCGDDLVKHFNP